MRRLSALAALACACAHGPPAPPAPPGFALKKSLPAEVCLPPGENVWLSRLRCPDGEKIKLVSHASAGTRNDSDSPSDPRLLDQLDPGRPIPPGDPDLHAIDAVTVLCSDGDRTLFVDMYHCAQLTEQRPPQGLQLDPMPPAPIDR